MKKTVYQDLVVLDKNEFEALEKELEFNKIQSVIAKNKRRREQVGQIDRLRGQGELKKELSSKTETEVAKMLDMFKAHPITQELEKQEEEKTYQERKDIIAGLHKIEAQYQEALKRAKSEVSLNEKTFKKTEEAYEQAKQKYQKAQWELTGLGLRFTTQTDRIKNKLRDMAPEVINNFIEDMKGLYSTLMREDRVYMGPTERDWTGRDKSHTVYSNMESLKNGLKVILENISEAEGLKYIDIEPPALKRRLQELTDRIPEIEVESYGAFVATPGRN